MADKKLLSDLNMAVSALYSGGEIVALSAEAARIVDMIRVGDFDALSALEPEILSAALCASNKAIARVQELSADNSKLRESMKSRELEAGRRARERLLVEIAEAHKRAASAEALSSTLAKALNSILEG